MVVKNIRQDHLKTTGWVFKIYLLLISLVILPIATAGFRLCQDNQTDADPRPDRGQIWLTILVYFGGFSALMAMIVITTITLSATLSNDAQPPFLIKKRLSVDRANVGPWLLIIRRFVMAGVILAA